MDEATKFQTQIRVVQLAQDDEALEFEIGQLHARMRYLGKVKSDKRRLHMSLLGQLEQTFVMVLADVERKTFGSCSPQLAESAKMSQELCYPEHSSSIGRNDAKDNLVNHGVD